MKPAMLSQRRYDMSHDCVAQARHLTGLGLTRLMRCHSLPDSIKENGWPSQLTASLIGSCTNSSYEDMTRSASIVRQALEAGIKVCTVPFPIWQSSLASVHVPV